MVIELFGPPGVGKTTFAHALGARLRERGFGATLALSYRPSENLTAADSTNTVRRRFPALRRVTRPIIESFTAASRLPRDSCEARAATALRNLFPPHDAVMALKRRQYMLRLSCAWHDAARADDIVLFDQAFVQLICTLASLARAARPGDLETALDTVPRPDLLVRLTAPLEVLTARLAERQRRLSTIERLLELDMETSLKSLEIADRLHGLLQRRNRMSVCIETSDRRLLHTAVNQVEEIIGGMRNRPAIRSGAVFEEMA
ncbi:MAG TPA: hypothetical protein VGR79_05450 [Stellaceae bacterium]|nr:hypothetical protein [Stellaceae bacterium]